MAQARPLIWLLAALALPAALPAAPASAAPLSRLVAPPGACPGEREAGAPLGRQLRAMRCLTNFARRRARQTSLAGSRLLDRSAAHKSRDIVLCDEFSHEACGRDFTYWMRRTGYIRGGCWRAGENLAVGVGRYATPRAIFEGWMRSEDHRRNMLGDYRDLGLGLRVGRLRGWRNAHVWTQHFGIHC
jgi:uncharacterized protein YkwD